MAFGQRGLDRRLVLQQPVQCMVELVLIDLTEAEQFAEARSGGGGRQRTCGREFGGRIEDPTDEQGKDEIATTIAVGAKDTVEADLAGGAERGGGVAVWQAADEKAAMISIPSAVQLASHARPNAMICANERSPSRRSGSASIFPTIFTMGGAARADQWMSQSELP